MKTPRPNPRVMLLLGAALSRPLVDVDPRATQPLPRYPLTRLHDEDLSAHPALQLTRSQSRGLDPEFDASGPRFPPGQSNPFGNRHQRRAANARRKV